MLGHRKIELQYNGKKQQQKIEAFEKRAKAIIDKLVDIQMSIDHLELIYDSNNKKLKEKASFFLHKFYVVLWRDVIVGLSTILEKRVNSSDLLNLQTLVQFIENNYEIFPKENHEIVTYEEDESRNNTKIHELNIGIKLEALKEFLELQSDLITRIVKSRDENIAHLKNPKNINITIIETNKFVKDFTYKLNDVHNEATAMVYSIKPIYQLDFKTVFRVFEEYYKDKK